MLERPFSLRVIGGGLLVLSILSPASAGQPGATPAGTLTIGGDVSQPLTLAAADLKSLPRSRVEVTIEDRTINVYEGVLVSERLKRAVEPLGPELTANALASYVIASAADGYEVRFSLAELDPALTTNDVIVADTLNGKPLGGSQGPLRIVAPHDRRSARSIRMLERLRLVRLRKD
jgi:DMSO/TMAO reductase YedYZ molybdopterin-dependent catalytic subunit